MTHHAKTYHLKITTKTPLHIGSGSFLLNGYDYAVRNAHVWRFNEDKILNEQDVDDIQAAEILARQRPIDLLTDEDYQMNSNLFRYILPGEPQATDGRLREFIKNVKDQPYIPASSLKGAIRTAIGWDEWDKKGMVATTQDIYDRRGNRKQKKYAAQDFERRIFGNDAHRDFMRAMVISDSPSLKQSDILKVINAVVYRRAGNMDKIDKISSLEVVAEDSTFEMDLKIDLALFSKWAKGYGLNLGSQDRLTNWVKICQEHAKQRLASEKAYYEKRQAGKPKSLFDWHEVKSKESLPYNSFFLQLGWGTGWDGKTFGSRLKASEEFMQEAIEVFSLGRGHHYASALDFPISRRLPHMEASGTLGEPLGWVQVDVEEIKGPNL